MEIKVENLNENFITWSEKPYLSEELKQSVIESDILIVPVENFRELNKPVFPQSTEEVFNFLKDNSPPDIHIEVCIEEKDYQEFALYDDTINIGYIVVTAIALPFLINLLSNYVSNKFSAKQKDNVVKMTFTIVNKEESNTITFEGDINNFLSSAEEIKNVCLPKQNTLSLSDNISKDLDQDNKAMVKKKNKSKRS